MRDPEREPDARLDHVPELLPHVRQARRHDRHGGHRGVRVPADLRPRDGGDPDAPADGPRRPPGPGLPHARRRSTRRSSTTSRTATTRGQPVLVGTTSIENSELLSGHAAEGEAAAPGAERQAARARGGDRRAGRPAEDDHHRHQHGGPRHRHRARRQRREADAISSRPTRSSRPRRSRRASRQLRGEWQELHDQVVEGGRPAHHRHRAPRVAAHRQPAARPLRPPGRPGQLALLPVARGSAAAHLRRRAHQPHHGDAEDARGRGDRARAWSRAPSRARSARSRRATSTSASSCSNTTTSPTTSARRSTRCATSSSSRRTSPQRIADLRAGVVDGHVPRATCREESVEEQWDIAGLERALEARASASSCRSRSGSTPRPSSRRRDACSGASSRAQTPPTTARSRRAPRSVRTYERYVMLQILDAHWREHLAALDHLRQGIHLRGYAQKNPKQEYKREAFELFGVMLEAVKLEVIKHLTAVQMRTKRGSTAGRRAAARRERAVPARGDSRTAAADGDGNGDVAIAEAATKRGPSRPRDAEGRPQRSLSLRLGQEIQALPRQADLGRLDGEIEVMAVNLARRRIRASLHPVARRASSASPWPASQEPNRKRSAAHALGAGRTVAGRLHAQPVLRRPGGVCAKNLPANEVAGARRQHGQRQRRHRRATGSKRALQVCGAARAAARLQAEAGAAVFDRRHHGAAARRAHRRADCRRRSQREATGFRRPRRS